MSDGNALDADEQLDLTPTEVFGLLAHETRMAAMRTLWETGDALRFSEIADHANIADTANFNYHLDKLRPRFVRKRDDEYILTHAGRRVLTSVLAGRFTGPSALEQTTVTYPCPLCGAELALERGEKMLQISCTECDGIYRNRLGNERLTKIELPPAGERESPTATLDAAMQWTYTRNWSFAQGVCPECAGPITKQTDICPDHESPAGLCDTCEGRWGVRARHQCSTCHESLAILPVVPLLTDRRVRSFYRKHGPDPMRFTFKAVGALVPYEETVLERDPDRFEMRITRDGETLVVTADEHISPISITRHAD